MTTSRVELEAKMKLDAPGPVEMTLQSLGATFIDEILENNTYFDTPDGSLRRSDRGLRIRIESREGHTPRVKLTYKGPRAPGRLKSREEIELNASDASKACDLFNALGFEPVIHFEKRRRKWRLDGCDVELDTLPLIGDFIEIEGPNDDAIMTLRMKLGLDKCQLITESYIGLLKSHLDENNLQALSVRFEPDKENGA